MVTAESVKAKLQGLISLANATTGKTDTDLTAAVNALIAGFGQGGSSGGTSGIYMAKITPAEDVNDFTVTHNLGTTDILLAACFAESLGDIVPDNGRGLGAVWAKTEIPNNRGGVGYSFLASYYATNSAVTCSGPNSASYWHKVVDSNNFIFSRPGSSSAKYEGGVTYTVVIMAASAFSVTEV